MDHVTLFLVALPVTVAVYGALGALHLRRLRSRRRVEAELAARGVDPYYAAGETGEVAPAAAAELLLAGLLEIDNHCVLRLTEAGVAAAAAAGGSGGGGGADGVVAGHPVPAALLEAVRRRHPKPVPLGRIVQRDAEFGERIRAFRAEQEAQLPPRPGRSGGGGGSGCLNCLGVLLIGALIGFVAFMVPAVLSSVPEGGTEWAAATGTALAIALIGSAQTVWERLPFPSDPDPVGAYCRLQQRHPALTALDERSHRRLDRSLFLGRRLPRSPAPRRPGQPWPVRLRSRLRSRLRRSNRPRSPRSQHR
ncbi:hypothetical protein DEJ50_30185 [Streptomyces venezuelae]|uniref:TIGR04222 domain-containing membrane protein n=1 Tax=Streptomyces venezuelae TaxID=54571 RepID=A0A5P2DA90_STRVZ|nr:hypothetical protein [Streptomyces venezuelae]QES51480.1 hypothetical protein DEJ50_30185 [Streptomyces venezuelae]